MAVKKKTIVGFLWQNYRIVSYCISNRLIWDEKKELKYPKERKSLDLLPERIVKLTERKNRLKQQHEAAKKCSLDNNSKWGILKHNRDE